MRDVLTREDVDAVGAADESLQLDGPRAAALAEILESLACVLCGGDGQFVRHDGGDLN
jgi:hypothetical protein